LEASLVEVVLAALEDLIGEHGFIDGVSGEAVRPPRSIVVEIVQRLLTEVGLQEWQVASDRWDMLKCALEKQTCVPDGPFQIEDQPVTSSDVERLIRIGAPSWMVERARELVEEPVAASLV